MAKVNAYDIITNENLDLLKQDIVPWRKTWRASEAARSVRGHNYRGINTFMLNMKAMTNGYADPRWITFKQSAAMVPKDEEGGVRKGEKSTPIVFWSWFDKKDDSGNITGKIPFLRYFRVFNVEQCDNLNIKPIDTHEEREHTPIESAEQIIADFGSKPTINHSGDRACYSPQLDIINMPKPELFESGEAYYATLFHEAVHATGHKSRLNRDSVTNLASFGSHAYSKEELCAEMGSAFLCSAASIATDESKNQSAAYIKSWLKALKNDPKMVVQAAALAQKAADLVLGVTFEKEAAKAA